jgi:hypothetical protein
MVGYIMMGGISMSHGRFAADGDAQNTTYILRGATTNASFTTIQNNGANVVLASNRTMMFTANIVGRRTDQVNASNSDNAAYVIKRAAYTMMVMEQHWWVVFLKLL